MCRRRALRAWRIGTHSISYFLLLLFLGLCDRPEWDLMPACLAPGGLAVYLGTTPVQIVLSANRCVRARCGREESCHLHKLFETRKEL